MTAKQRTFTAIGWACALLATVLMFGPSCSLFEPENKDKREVLADELDRWTNWAMERVDEERRAELDTWAFIMKETTAAIRSGDTSTLGTLDMSVLQAVLIEAGKTKDEASTIVTGLQSAANLLRLVK